VQKLLSDGLGRNFDITGVSVIPSHVTVEVPLSWVRLFRNGSA